MRVITLVLLIAATSLAADKIVGGPYVVNPAARSASIGWVIESDPVSITTPAKRLIPVLRSEKVSVTGLKPGETVEYEIPGPGPIDSRRGHFRVPAAAPWAAAIPAPGAAPAPPPTPVPPFHFVVFGDTRTRDDMHRRVIQAISKTDPDFVVHTGDLVTDGFDSSQWPVFFDIERELLRKTVFYPVLGNHERDNARYYEFFDVKVPYASFNWGGIHFVTMDSDVANVAPSPAERDRFWTSQLRWLEDDLKSAQKADYRIAVMHHPVITANPAAAHMSKLTPELMPIFEKYNVQVVFSGHDHNYQHHVKSGIHYVVTGGGGAPLAAVDAPVPGVTQKVEKVEHFVTVKVHGKHLSIQAIALDGHTIDTIELGQ